LSLKMRLLILWSYYNHQLRVEPSKQLLQIHHLKDRLMAMQFRKESSNLKPLTLFSQSSLTDIILLLLIFFLLTSSFVSNYGIQVNIPSASTASAGETQQITVSITEEGRYFLDGNEIEQSVLGAELRVALEGKENPILVIRADRQSKLEESVYVMNLGKALDLPLVIAADRQFN